MSSIQIVIENSCQYLKKNNYICKNLFKNSSDEFRGYFGVAFFARYLKIYRDKWRIFGKKCQKKSETHRNKKYRQLIDSK